MTTLAIAIQQLLRRTGLGIYLPNADIDSLSTSAVVSTKWLRSGNMSTNSLRGENAIIWRPTSNTAADNIRYAGDLTIATGSLAPDAAWTDGTVGSEDFYVLRYGLHPQWLIDAANMAAATIYFPNIEPLSLKPIGTGLADAGFQSTLTSWFTESDSDGGPATTFSKVTTANSENVQRGIGSGRVLNAADGGYIRQRYYVTPGERVSVYAVSRLDSGTNAQLTLWDVSNGVEIGTTVEHDLEKWQYMKRVETMPTGCKILEVRLKGEGITADVYWNGIFVMPLDARRLILDTKWDSAHKVLKLIYARLRGVSAGEGIWDAASAVLDDVPSNYYSFDIERPGANPNAIVFDEQIVPYLDKPIYIQGKRLYSDIVTFALSDLTTSIAIDIDLFVAEMTLQLLQMGDVSRHVPEVEKLLQAAYWNKVDALPRSQIDGPRNTMKYASWGSSRV